MCKLTFNQKQAWVVAADGDAVGRVIRETRVGGEIISVTIEERVTPLAPSDPTSVVFYRVKKLSNCYRSRFVRGTFRLVYEVLPAD